MERGSKPGVQPTATVLLMGKSLTGNLAHAEPALGRLSPSILINDNVRYFCSSVKFNTAYELVCAP